MLSEEFHNSHEFRKYTLVASSRALQNMRADVLNIEKLSNRFEGEMRRREHIHHMALSPLIEQPLMTDGRNILGVCIHTCVGALPSSFGAAFFM